MWIVAGAGQLYVYPPDEEEDAENEAALSA